MPHDIGLKAGWASVAGEDLPWLAVLLTGMLGSSLLVFALDHAMPKEAAAFDGSSAETAEPRGGSRLEQPEARGLPSPAVQAEDAEALLEGELSGVFPTSGVGSGTAEPCAPGFEVRFGLGRSRAELAEEQLAGLVDWLEDHPHAVLVEGHSDAVGNEEENLRLSHRRADYVAWRLIRAGAPRPRIVRRAFGEFLPRAGVEANAEAQRRVVVRVDGLPTCEGDLLKREEGHGS